MEKLSTIVHLKNVRTIKIQLYSIVNQTIYTTQSL